MSSRGDTFRLAPGSRGPLGLRGVGSSPPSPSLARSGTGVGGFLRHLDWLLLVVVGALCVLGTLLVWSATEPGLRQAGADPHTYLFKEVLWFGIGAVLMFAVA